MLHRVKPSLIRPMTPTVSQRVFWGALVAAAAPYALYLVFSRRVRPPRVDVSFTEADVFDDEFDDEVAASTG